MPDYPEPPKQDVYEDGPNRAAISVIDHGRTLAIRFLNFDSGAPVAISIEVHKNCGIEGLRAAIQELFVNEDVYAALFGQHLAKLGLPVAPPPPDDPPAPTTKPPTSSLKAKLTGRNEKKR